MNKSSNTYLLAVGKKGEERLGILNELFGPTSHELLLRVGLKKGMRVLDVGCGTGNMTEWIAEQVGTEGSLVAVDISADQLEIAKKNCAAKKLKNISFVESSVFDLKDLAKFDLIYTRFIIMHLAEPQKALSLLVDFLKPGGFLVSEEAANAVTCCYPPSPVFQKHRQLLQALSEKKNLDFSFGEKIYSSFRELQLKNISVNFIQPILQTRRQKRLIPLLYQEVGVHYIQNGLASQAEIDALLVELSAFIENDEYLVSFARTTQIIGQAA
jgi:ubiquinone/menaquinone biosynthesis C-methylase UbiE